MGNVFAGEDFAQEHYNIPKADFMQKVKEEFGSVVTLEARAAIAHFNEIQMEMEGVYLSRRAS
jgi:hypothetical protein